MAKLPGRIPAAQVSGCSDWQPPAIDAGNGDKLIRLASRRISGKMDLSQIKRPPEKQAAAPVAQEKVSSAKPEGSQPAEPVLNVPGTMPAQEQEAVTTPPPTDVEQAQSCQPAQPSQAQEATPTDAKSADDGYAEGYAKGYRTGETEGSIQGEKAGYDPGFSAGSEAGRQQAEAAFGKEVEEQRTAIQALQQAFLQPPDPDQSLQLGLVALVTELTKVIVCHEVTSQPQFIQSLVQQALNALPHGTPQPKIRANPSDIEHLQSMSLADVEFIPDAAIARGGCRVIAGQSEVEAGLAERIQNALIAACRGDQVPNIEESDLQSIESSLLADPDTRA